MKVEKNQHQSLETRGNIYDLLFVVVMDAVEAVDDSCARHGVVHLTVPAVNVTTQATRRQTQSC